MDSLTRTTLQFDAAVSDLAIAETIDAFHRVPGVLYTETSVGVRRALVAHDDGVTLATLIGTATNAGATVKVVVTAQSRTAAPHLTRNRKRPAYSYAAFALTTACLVLFFLRILTVAELQWVAPLLLTAMIAESIIRRLQRR